MERECAKASVQEPSSSSGDAMTFDISLAQDKRNDLLAAYTKRYQSTLQLEQQPSEATLTLLIKRHLRRSADFVQLSKVTNMIDGRDCFNEPLKLGRHLSINLEGAMKRKVSDFNSSPEAFVHAVRVLMFGYALVSAADQGPPWCSLDAAQKHISTVENLSRMSARGGHINHQRIVEAEMNVRCEWTRVAQAESILCLSDIIEIVSQRFTMWPVITDLKGSGGKGISKLRSVANYNPYNDSSSSSWQSYTNWHSKDKLITIFLP